MLGIRAAAAMGSYEEDQIADRDGLQDGALAGGQGLPID